jgi:predicted nucleic acid-binding protein
VIFIDTNIFYNIFCDTKFSDIARRFIEENHNLVTSFTVLNELIYVSVRDLCMERYGTKNYASFKKFIIANGYQPFGKEIEAIFLFMNAKCVSFVPVNDDINHWQAIMQKYRLMPYDALIASTCFSNEIVQIATFDQDFRRVDFLILAELH